MNINNRLFAILGGMGPDASARLITRIIELSREIGGAKNSDDYPNFVMQNIPVSDFFDNPDLYLEGLSLLKKSVINLSRLKPEYFAIACNTAHSLIPELQKVTKIPFVQLPQLIADEIKQSGYKQVGLLATPLTYKSQIYVTAFKKKKIKIVEPADEDKIELGKIVHLILSGKFETGRRRLVKIADKLILRGVDVLLLGCTELPLVFPKKYPIPFISSVESLARNLVIKYYQKGEL